MSRYIAYADTNEEIQAHLRVLLDNYSIREVGIVTDLLPLLANLSVVENVMITAQYHGGMKRREAELVCIRELKKYGLEHALHYRQNQLNEYEIFVVKFMQAVIMQPPRLLFIAPHRMIHADLRGKFCPFVSNLENHEVTVLEHKNFREMYDGNLNFEEITFDQWLIRDSKTSS